MIFHLSIDADDPQRVATVLAELWGGEALPFPPVYPGSWVALAGDERGTMIEVYPAGVTLVAGEGDAGAVGRREFEATRGTPTHAAIATSLARDDVYAIAAREGWLAKYCKRGGRFGVIEFWIENRMMVEVLTREMQREYLETISIANWRAMLSAASTAQAA
jgi:hypothetical protein